MTLPDRESERASLPRRCVLSRHSLEHRALLAPLLSPASRRSAPRCRRRGFGLLFHILSVSLPPRQDMSTGRQGRSIAALHIARYFAVMRRRYIDEIETMLRQ